MWTRIALTLILVVGAFSTWALATGELTFRFHPDEPLWVVPPLWINIGFVIAQSILIALLVAAAAVLSHWRDRLFPPRTDRDDDL